MLFFIILSFVVIFLLIFKEYLKYKSLLSELNIEVQNIIYSKCSNKSINTESLDLPKWPFKKSIQEMAEGIQLIKKQSSKIKELIEENSKVFSKYTISHLYVSDLKKQSILLQLKNSFEKLNILYKSPLLKTLLEARYKEQEEVISDYQRNYYELERLNYMEFFDKNYNNERRPTEDQINAIISDNPANLVNAGAGSGKTFTVLKKIEYLIKNKDIPAQNILVLSFSKKAKNELEERIKTLKIDMPEVRTIHSLGVKIIKDVQDSEFRIFPDENNKKETALTKIVDLMREEAKNDPHFSDSIIEFFKKHQYYEKALHEYKTFEAYKIDRAIINDQLVSKYIPRSKNSCKIQGKSIQTLSGIYVRSMEELRISDILFLAGVNFEYEKEYPHNKNYNPDFYLPDYDLYLEHFGVDRDGEVPEFFESRNRGVSASEEYLKDMEWKRELHKKHNTKLAQTYSYNFSDGNFEESLMSELKGFDVEISEVSLGGLSEKLTIKLGKLMSSTIAKYRQSMFTMDEIKCRIGNESDIRVKRRFENLFRIFIKVHELYVNYLTDHNLIDFSDMINVAIKYCDEGHYNRSYDYIIVDEFQDTSSISIELLKHLYNMGNHTRFYFVGDDWQSIYGFNGSDISLMLNAHKDFNDLRSVSLNKNFRSNANIVNVSRDFILKNPDQLIKHTESGRGLNKDENEENHNIHFLDSSEINSFLINFKNWLIKNNKKSDISIRFLCRTNKDIAHWRDYIDFYGTFSDVSFSTIHSEKGGEYNAIIILPSLSGIPSTVESDAFEKLFMKEAESFLFAEERRLYYVALTRAKDYLVIVEDNEDQVIKIRNKVFLDELKRICLKLDAVGNGIDTLDLSMDEINLLIGIKKDSSLIDLYGQYLTGKWYTDKKNNLHGSVKIGEDLKEIKIYQNTGLYIYKNDKSHKTNGIENLIMAKYEIGYVEACRRVLDKLSSL
jgi:DNA helicase-4